MGRGSSGIIGEVNTKTLLFSFNVSPTSHYRGPYPRIEDYKLEVSMTAAALKLGILSFFY